MASDPASIPENYILDVHDLSCRDQPGQRERVAYILETDSSAQERNTIDTFATLEGVKTPDGREPNRRELEDVYWRCKDFDSGYILAYAAQRIFDSLPPSTKLHARTSSKHELLCKPSDVAVAEIDLLTNEACLIVVKEPRPDLVPSKVNMAQHLIGFADSTPPARRARSCAGPELGGRGSGGEPFALRVERAIVYHKEVLAKVAGEYGKFEL
ncbi:hypothetical protein ONZ51_g8513 [Trametes cubensis]|uniref:Uncharacterized protein n=1 Tax=Trametes cubensis TaxID=1111947 RepID=A0AAD7TPA0_9APHY|nr:hypothetical protein ONZ51_g8513 [Trametes cubensis]